MKALFAAVLCVSSFLAGMAGASDAGGVWSPERALSAVPLGTEFLFVADLEQARQQPEALALLRGIYSSSRLARQRTAAERCNFDPLRDLRRVHIFAAHNSISTLCFVLEGDFDQLAITAYIAQRSGTSVVTSGLGAVYSFPYEGRTVYTSFARSDLLVAAFDAEVLRLALAVASGQLAADTDNAAFLEVLGQARERGAAALLTVTGGEDFFARDLILPGLRSLRAFLTLGAEAGEIAGELGFADMEQARGFAEFLPGLVGIAADAARARGDTGNAAQHLRAVRITSGEFSTRVNLKIRYAEVRLPQE